MKFFVMIIQGKNVSTDVWTANSIDALPCNEDENASGQFFSCTPPPLHETLTNTAFLTKYKKILKSQGILHLKTDSEFMHGYTLGLLHGLGAKIDYANHDVYHNAGAPAEVLEIQTFYEKQYLEKNKPITYIQFRLTD